MNRISDFLNVSSSKREMISFVGGGGKTSSMFRLAYELRDEGMNVLVTTTTKIFVPDKNDYDELIINESVNLDIFSLLKKGITVLGLAVSKENKLLGVSPDFLDQVFSAGIFDCILVEADGAKQMPIKAPSLKEPVIPLKTTKTVGVVGLGCLQQEIGSIAFRPEVFAQITNSNISDVLDTKHIWRLIKAREGLFKNVPSASERYLFLNQAENETAQKAAAEIINMFMPDGFELDGIIAGSLWKNQFLDIYPHEKITGIIMASGFSVRMGQDKLLLTMNDGLPLVEKVIKAADASELNEIIIVYQNDEVRKIAEKYRTKPVYNPNAAEGQSEAVKLGIESTDASAAGYMFLTGDQPYIDSQLINQLLNTFKRSSFPILVPFYNGCPGIPTIFSAYLQKELMQLNGDEGGRSIIRRNPGKVKRIDILDWHRGIDIDTPEQLPSCYNDISR